MGKQTTWNVGVYGILNAEGKPWTSETFKTIARGEEYLVAQGRNNPNWNLSKHTVVPVSVTVRAIRVADGGEKP